MDFHDLKDIVMIYSSDKDGKPDYEWEHANIVVWDPKRQRKGKLVFTGSSKPENEINFNIDFDDDLWPCVTEAFGEVLEKMKENNFDMSINWEMRFLENMLKHRRKEKKK